MCVSVLGIDGSLVGVVQAINKQDDSGSCCAFGKDDETMLSKFAEQIAVAIRNCTQRQKAKLDALKSTQSVEQKMKLLQQDNNRLQLEHESVVRKLQQSITRMEIDVQNLTSAQASMAKANDMNAVFNQVVAQSRRLTNADRATLFILDK